MSSNVRDSGQNVRTHRVQRVQLFPALLKKVIIDITKFLDHPLSASHIEDLSDYLEFVQMSQNKMANPTAGMKLETGNFMRKGQVGDWKTHLQKEMAKHMEKWMELYKMEKEF